MTLTPASRSLDAVLRDALAQPGGLRVLAGTYAASQPSDRRYANVTLGGVTLSVPNLNGVSPGAAGQVAYVLADDTRMWVLGAVTPTGSAGGAGLATGTRAARPAANTVSVGGLYYATDNGITYQTDGVSTWTAIGWEALPATVLPTSPTPEDGQQIRYVANSAAGVVWVFTYRAATSKWEFTGGSPLYAEAPAQVTLAVGAGLDFTDGVPTITLPFPGDYMVEFGAAIYHSAGNQFVYIGPFATGLSYVSTNGFAIGQPASGGSYVSGSRRYRAVGVSGTLKMQSQAGATGGAADRRWITCQPIRVG